MKTQTIIRMLSLSLLFMLWGAIAMAQTKDERASKEAEMKAKQEQIEQQRQQMKEQQQKTIHLERAYAEQARESARSSGAARVYSYSTGDEPYFVSLNSQENQSSLTLRNSFHGTSDSSQGEFDVNDGTSHIRCTINGKVRSGKINIKVLYPGGKVFKDLSITSSAEISFTQSLSIKEEEKNKYVGAWTYKISSDKAEGSYNLSFMTH